MKLWWLLIVGLLVQEPISSNGLLFEAYQHHFNLWLVHLIFVFATILDIFFGHVVGTFIKNHYAQTRIVKYIERQASVFTSHIDKRGRRITIFIFGSFVFPYCAFLEPWLGLNFWETAVWFFFGNLIFWYGFEWALILGVKKIFPNPNLALYGLLGLSLIFSILIKYIGKRFFIKIKVDSVKTIL